jgi:hypothetical protein
MQTVFRRHNDGTVTDVFEDSCVWVRDGEIASMDVLVSEEQLAPATEGLSTAAPMPTKDDVPTTFDEMRAFFVRHPVDALVFTHADGRQAQVTREDFGLAPLEGVEKGLDELAD